MKLKQLLLTTLLSVVFNSFLTAQSYKIIYEMKWRPTQNATQYNTELCALITGNGQASFFESYENFRQDSLKTRIITEYAKNDSKGSLRIPSSTKTSLFRPLIIKNVVDKKITVEERLYIKTFITEYLSCPIHWKIQPGNTEQVFGYKAEKAVCEFGGRTWTAWFTPDIPIMDGPYKFYGLPGLILKIQDSREDYIFEIKGLTKEENDIGKRNFGSQQSVKLSPKQWASFWEGYKKLPASILENLNTSQTTYVINGKNTDSREVKEEYNKKEWNAIKAFENPIELSQPCN
jgi:GLPGLI family protein